MHNDDILPIYWPFLSKKISRLEMPIPRGRNREELKMVVILIMTIIILLK